MKKPALSVLLCSFFAVAGASARSQSLPAAPGSVPNVGFQLPRLGGSLTYALNASELISTGFYGTGTAYTTNLSGDLAYLSNSQTHPFSAVYAGGVLLANSGQPNTTYQTLSLSQTLQTKNWNFNLSDFVSYLPESPVTGLSGIPGVGDVGVTPVTVGPQEGVGILTNYGPRVSNTLTGSASRVITAHISAQGSAFYSNQSFIGDNSNQALSNSDEGGSVGLSYRLSQLSAINGNYNYSHFNYANSPDQFTVQGATFAYSRQWNRKFTTNVFAGPQIISSDDASFHRSSTELAAGASASYQARTVFYTLSYSRGVNNGSGVLPGSFSDNVVAAARRQFGRAWSVSGSLGYSRTSSVPALETVPFSSDGVAASGQVTRGFGRRFSGYASYTVEDQGFGGGSSTPINAFNGVYQVVGVGVTYSPGSISLGK